MDDLESLYDQLDAYAGVIRNRDKRIAELESLTSTLRQDAQNWRDFAEHQTWCAVCAESVDSCSEGRDLRMAALANQKEPK